MTKIYMLGIDLSNHQGRAGIDLDKVLTNHPECKVVIIKVSEGVHFTDAYAQRFVDIALRHGCLVAVYHYARADVNDWQSEASFFLKLAKPYLGKVLFVLDWEVKAAAGKVTWAKNFLDYVKKQTGTTPIFYSYESMINAYDFTPISGYPLWVAKYRDYGVDKNFDMSSAGSAPSVKWWSSYIAWQWTSVGRLDGYDGNLDCNAFYIDEAQWMAYLGGSKAEVVPYTFPTTSPVLISNSGSDERGNYRGGAAGDQTGGEWRKRDWYSRPWNCALIHPSAIVRAYIAHLATQAAENDYIGYDQNQRWTFWDELQKTGFDPSKIKKACEADCSSGIIAITKAVGHLLSMDELKNVSATYTGNMRSAYKVAGFQVMTDAKYTAQDAYLPAGAILLNDAHHVCTVISNGRLSGSGTTKEDYEMLPLLKRGSKGKAVKWLQIALGGLEVDGSFGWKTLNAVIAFQKAHGLAQDGEVGPKTWAAIINSL